MFAQQQLQALLSYCASSVGGQAAAATMFVCDAGAAADSLSACICARYGNSAAPARRNTAAAAAAEPSHCLRWRS